MSRTVPHARAAAAACLLVAVAACDTDGEDPLAEGGDGEQGAAAVTVGSANFPESSALAEVYAQALEAAGISVDTQLEIGSREIYYDQVESGEISVMPEYIGNLLLHVDPEAETGDAEQIREALQEALPADLEILASSEADNNNEIVVTAQTADELELASIADLQPYASDMALGGPPEFEERQAGVLGLEDAYGLEFGEFRALDAGGPITVENLDQDEVQVATLFTTDPAIEANDFVMLEDPENVFPAQLVTPLIHADDVDEDARAVLDQVSEELTSADLVEMNRAMAEDRLDPRDVAADWLEQAGLV
jgi:osmoprotectant transport system substrate-binding protein